LGFFFRNQISPDQLEEEEVLQRYIRLDDNDVEFAIKQWQWASDPVLSDLSQALLGRRLLKIRLQGEAFDAEKVKEIRQGFAQKKGISFEDAGYFVFSGQVKNQAYTENSKEPILVWFKDGQLRDLSEATDMQNIHALASPVVKHYFCAPSDLIE
ncbi:MAG: phosphohydrolase, partial [Bacteroidota bacterium]